MPRPSPSRLAQRIEHWPLERLRRNPANAKTHPPEQIQALARSIDRYGFNQPILVGRVAADKSAEIVAGHGRLEAAELLKLELVPVVVLEHLSDDERAAYVLADNRTAELGGWDDAALAREIARLEATGTPIDALGWSDAELDALARSLDEPAAADPKSTRSPLEDIPEPKVPKIPVACAGDLWLLGPHRLLCADSTKPENIAKLLGDKRVDCAITDPPYAIYGSSTGVASDVADDRMVEPFFQSVFDALGRALRYGGHAYVFCDWRSWPTIYRVAAATELAAKNCVVWNKGLYGLGSNYQNAHEFAGFFHLQPKQKTVWKAASERAKHRAVTGANIVEFPRVVGDAKHHNAEKPLALIAHFLKNSSDEGDLVFDGFVGSGTTLIAAHTTGRVARAMEIEPKTVDVAIARWRQTGGEEPKLEGGGTFDEVAAERARSRAKASNRRRR